MTDTRQHIDLHKQVTLLVWQLICMATAKAAASAAVGLEVVPS